MIKIFFISHTSRLAGAEVTLLTLLRNLDRSRFEPVVVFPADGPLKGETELLGVRTYVSPLEWWVRVPRTYGLLGSGIRERVGALERIIREERPDVVHTNTSVVWEGALAAALVGIPHVWHLHERLEGHTSLKPLFPLQIVQGLIGLLSSNVVAVSEAVRAQTGHGLMPEKLVVIHNGIQAMQPDDRGSRSVREELGLPPDLAVAVSVGSVVPEKDYDTLLAAAGRAAAEKAPVRFLIAGGGPPEAAAELQGKIESFGLSGYVRYLGRRSDIPRLLAAADLFVLSSRTEAFSLVVGEAMAAGRAVIATACGGPEEMVLHGETGYVVPVGDPEDLWRAVAGLLGDPALRALMGESGRKRYEEHFTADRCIAAFQKLYREAAEAGTPPLAANDRIFLEGMMDTYQRISEGILARGFVAESRQLAKRAAASPLALLQRFLDGRKRGRA